MTRPATYKVDNLLLKTIIFMTDQPKLYGLQKHGDVSYPT
jgi:hypothetical protein